MTLPALYTTELFAAHNVGATNFTVPPSARWVATCITVFFSGGVTAQQLQIVNPVTLVTRFYVNVPGSIGGQFAVFNDLRICFLEGQTFDVTGAEGPDVSITGYVFQLP